MLIAFVEDFQMQWIKTLPNQTFDLGSDGAGTHAEHLKLTLALCQAIDPRTIHVAS
jgi:hypothetical protein